MTLKWVKAPSKKFTNEGISYWPGSERMTINIQALRRVLCLWSHTHVASISKTEMIKHTLIMTHTYTHRSALNLCQDVSRARCAGRRTPQTVWVRVYAGTCRQILVGCQIKQRRTLSMAENLHGVPRNMFKCDTQRLNGTETACRTFLLWITQSLGRTTHKHNKTKTFVQCPALQISWKQGPKFGVFLHAASALLSIVKNGVESWKTEILRKKLYLST